MATDDKIRDEKLQYNITEKLQKYEHCYPEKLINMNILQMKEYYLPIKAK